MSCHLAPLASPDRADVSTSHLKHSLTASDDDDVEMVVSASDTS